MNTMTLSLLGAPVQPGAPPGVCPGSCKGIRSCELGSGPSAKALSKAWVRAAWFAVSLSPAPPKPGIIVPVGACSGALIRVAGRVTTKLPVQYGWKAKVPLPAPGALVGAADATTPGGWG